ncbi:MAG TPA: homocysteine S-methyltransferase [Longimicrobiales bacterium]|nr:homocysteine S-methyltransferase [Longimicrobiales bacterium]
MSPLQRFLTDQGFVVLDGGLGTALEAAGHVLDPSLWSAGLVLEAPDAILEAHHAFLAAGADCIESAGYQASVPGFVARGLSHGEAVDAVRRSVALAREAVESFWSEPANRAGRLQPIVAASAGPYGAYLADGSEYHGRYGVDAGVLERFHRERLEILSDAGADVIAIETIPSLAEAEIVARALEALHGVRAWVSFTCRDGAHLRDGSDVADAVRAMESVAALAAVGVNCTAPGFVDALVARIAALTPLPLVVYPNSGEAWDAARAKWLGSPAGWDWVVRVPDWHRAGARLIGGCCRVGPDLIREIRAALEGTRRPR